MARTYAQITGLVLQMLQDTGAAVYVAAETGYAIEESLKEFATFIPHTISVVFQIESRTGTDSTGTASSLTDSVESQFLSTDPTNEKVIRNTTDHTWAVVEGFTSTSVLTLSADIMDANENYRIYNKRCWNEKQIYIGDFTDYLGIDSVEYPIGTKRNWKVYDEVLEIDVDTVSDSDTTQTYLPNVDVLVRFAVPHRLNQLTTLTGELTADESKGDTTIAVDGLLPATGDVEIGEEFHLEHHRSVYIITSATTLVSGAGDITFYPPLEAAASDSDDITFRKSTLQPQHEEIFCHLVAARTALSKGALSLIQIGTAITTLTTVNSRIDDMTDKITQASADLTSGQTEVAKTPAIITKAEKAITEIHGQITLALADLQTGRAFIDEVNKGAGVPTTHVNYATTNLASARALAEEANANLRQAAADESVAVAYSGLASGQLSQATSLLSQARGYMSEITSRLNVASSFRLYNEWGERKLAEVLGKLDRNTKPKTRRIYPKD